jgi:hypothetical protein
VVVDVWHKVCQACQMARNISPPPGKKPVTLSDARRLLREAFLGHATSSKIHELAARLYDMAMTGDLQAAKLYLTNTLGKVENEQEGAASVTVTFNRPEVDPGESDPI